MGSRLRSLLLKEMIQFFRDRVLLGLILFLYIGDTIMCTLALSYDVKHVPMAILDQDRSLESRDLAKRFFSTDAFRSVGDPVDEAQASAWLQSGRTMATVVIPKNFGRALRAHPPAKLQILLDGSNSNTALITRGYALKIVQMFSQAWAPKAVAQQAMTVPTVRVWFNPSLTFTAFMVLSMIGTAGVLAAVIQPAAFIVREKEIGTIEQLMITPIRTGEMFAAKTLPALLMGLLALFPSLLVVHFFGVTLRGSVTLFLSLSALFLVSAIAMGVLVASVTRTLQQALLLSFFGLFPILFLSGTLVPVESMPKPLQILSLASPLRHYTDVILGIFLKGVGIEVLWPQALALLAIGSTLYLAAWWRFSRS